MEEAENLQAPSAAQAAYADVDGTLTAYNTIFGFLRFDAAERGMVHEAEDFLHGLQAAAREGAPRSVTNARYFSWWRGRSVQEVEELGERWAEVQQASPGDWGFLEPVASLMDHHLLSGRRIVAVTASFPPALVRVLHRWPSLEVLCTVPLTDGGLYTGGISEAMVGQAKADAVAAHAERHGVDLAASFAYGDHCSDLPFMELAGQSLFVGPDAAPAVSAALSAQSRTADRNAFMVPMPVN